MAVKVDVLNGLNISGLRLSIDETNGRVIETRAILLDLHAAVPAALFMILREQKQL